MTDWFAVARAKQARYESPHGELDERAVVRLGNTAYAAGLALLMAGSEDASAWLLRAAETWRASWDLGTGAGSWGRPVGALKAALLARDDDTVQALAVWTLGLDAPAATSPIGRYAAVLALLSTEFPNDAFLNDAFLNDASLNDASLNDASLNDASLNDASLNDALLVAAAAQADWLRERDDFPRDVADALAALAAGDPGRLEPSVASVVRSFETRARHLEDVPVADTALVLQLLARRRGLDCELPASPVLPA